ncbi:MAG: HupE/UreJ family protein [Burkholderiales bacterium]|nr:MAG: HupE/UreJ family protein [Burkholderiales bacterium]
MTRLLLMLFALVCSAAQAHQASEAYLVYRVEGAAIEQRLDVALRDLDRDLTLDANGDAELSWGEVRARWPDIEALADDGVRFTADGAACTRLDRGPPQLDEHSDGTHAVLVSHWRCPQDVHELQVDYRLFARTDAAHRGLARIAGTAGEPRVLVPGRGPQTLSAEQRSVTGFIAEGIAHIASGLDHVLFLVTLLLVAVWRRDGRGWAPRDSARSAFAETLRLVTAFTLAHSVTLGLAASGLIDPPAAVVESLIALTVLLAALDNLRPFVPGPRWLMVGAFGLVHGIGFAGPLKDLGLRGAELVLPLMAFNLGVELGQLAVVALLLPAALWCRRAVVYRRWIVPGGSGAIAVLALLWCVERSLAVQLLP